MTSPSRSALLDDVEAKAADATNRGVIARPWALWKARHHAKAGRWNGPVLGLNRPGPG